MLRYPRWAWLWLIVGGTQVLWRTVSTAGTAIVQVCPALFVVIEDVDPIGDLFGCEWLLRFAFRGRTSLSALGDHL